MKSKPKLNHTPQKHENPKMHRSNPINNTKLTFIFTNISQSHIGFENISLLPHLFYVLLVTASLAVSLFCLFRKNARPEKKLKFSENRKKGLIGELGQPLSLPQNLRDRFGPNFKPSRHAPFAVFFLLVHCAPFFFGPARVFWAVMVRLNAGDLENMVKTKHFVSDYRSHAEMLQVDVRKLLFFFFQKNIGKIYRKRRKIKNDSKIN